MKAIVQEQTPKSTVLLHENSMVVLYTYKPQNEVTTIVPDVKNKTISEAKAAFRNAGINLRINGSGTAISQEYPAGTKVKKGDIVEVQFRNVIAD